MSRIVIAVAVVLLAMTVAPGVASAAENNTVCETNERCFMYDGNTTYGQTQMTGANQKDVVFGTPIGTSIATAYPQTSYPLKYVRDRQYAPPDGYRYLCLYPRVAYDAYSTEGWWVDYYGTDWVYVYNATYLPKILSQQTAKGTQINTSSKVGSCPGYIA